MVKINVAEGITILMYIIQNITDKIQINDSKDNSRKVCWDLMRWPLLLL